MTNAGKNYAKEEKSRKRLIVLLLIFFVIAAILVGVISAYYSDVLEDDGTTSTSTLKIEGTYTVSVNGKVTTLDAIGRLDPGDVIVIKGNVSNVGNQCAWIREKITINSDPVLYDYLEFYTEELTQEDFFEGENLPNAVELSGEGVVAGTNKVIDGSGDDAQTLTGEDFFLESHIYEFVFTIRFVEWAPNSTQGKTLTISVVTQALQYNNNIEPDEAAWSAVQGG